MQSKIFRSVNLETPISDSDIIKHANAHLYFRKRVKCALEIDIVGIARMRSLNKKFMGRDYPTDVLSFPVANFPTGSDYDFIGTVVLCNDIISKQAKKLNKTFEEEFLFYLSHGIDHLIGIHHN